MDDFGIKTPGGPPVRGKDEALVNTLKSFLVKELAGLEDRMMKQMKVKFDEFQASLEFNSGQVEDIAKSIKNVEQKIILIENKQVKLDIENKELKTRLKNMEGELQGMLQVGLNNKLEISGLPPAAANNIKAVAEEFIQKVGIEVNEIGQYQVEKPFRPESAKVTVVMTFKSAEIRNKVLGKIKQEKNYLKVKDVMRNTNDESFVFVNELLTPYYRKLFYQANLIKKEKKYSFLWVKDGKILLKKTVGAKTFRLTNMEDLGKM